METLLLPKWFCFWAVTRKNSMMLLKMNHTNTQFFFVLLCFFFQTSLDEYTGDIISQGSVDWTYQPIRYWRKHIQRVLFQKIQTKWHLFLALNTPGWYELQRQFLSCALQRSRFLSITEGYPPSYCKRCLFKRATAHSLSKTMGHSMFIKCFVFSQLCRTRKPVQAPRKLKTKAPLHASLFPGGLTFRSSTAISFKTLEK